VMLLLGDCWPSYCQHGGTCSLTTKGRYSRYQCQCPPGWHGVRCGQYHDVLGERTTTHHWCPFSAFGEYCENCMISPVCFYCDDYVCFSVRPHNSKTTWLNFTIVFPYGCGLLLCQHVFPVLWMT